MNNTIQKISVCMGSSCFARGNDKNLNFLESYLKENPDSIRLDLYGTRCENQCSVGPNITIGDRTYNNVTLKVLKEILKSLNLPSG